MVSGHVYRVEGKRRPVWRAKYRLPDRRLESQAEGRASPTDGLASRSVARDSGGELTPSRLLISQAISAVSCRKDTAYLHLL